LRACYIKWTLVKAWFCVINFQRLPLRLVHGHRKTQIDGKLKAHEFEWTVTFFFCYYWGSRNTNNITFGTPSQNFYLNVVFFFKDFTCNLMPLHNFGTFRFRIKIIEAPIFIVNFCGGSPGGFNEF